MLRFLLCFSLIISSLLAEEEKKTTFTFQALQFPPSTFEGLLALDPVVSAFIPIPFREAIRANSFKPTPDQFYEDAGVLMAEKIFERYCQERSPSCPLLIPPIVHLIWLGSTPTPAVEIAVASWKKYHPHWEIKLWTDKEIIDFAWSNSHSASFFTQAKNWAEKSDILRFEILYQFGGIYSDTDVICLNTFEDMLTGLNFFAGFEENRIQKNCSRPLIGSAIIGAAKNHPILKQCIAYSQTESEAPGVFQHFRSGPGPLTKAIYEALESESDAMLLLPCSYFYSLPYVKRTTSLDEIKENIRPESLAIHLWEGSWF